MYQYQILRSANIRVSGVFLEKHNKQSFLRSPILRYLSRQSSSSDTANSPMAAAHNRDKCVFCKIADGKEKNTIFFEDEEVIVFEDIRPAAKYHLLVIPKEHIKDSKSLVPDQLNLLDRMIEVGNKVLSEKLASDSSIDASKVQKVTGFHWPPFHTVSHLHLHVIAPSDQMSFLARTIFRPNSMWFVTPEYVRDRLVNMDKNSPSGKAL